MMQSRSRNTRTIAKFGWHSAMRFRIRTQPMTRTNFCKTRRLRSRRQIFALKSTVWLLVESVFILAATFIATLRNLVTGLPRSSGDAASRSEEHTSELQSHSDLVCRLLLEKKKKKK